jgi:hypothetical protein
MRDDDLNTSIISLRSTISDFTIDRLSCTCIQDPFYKNFFFFSFIPTQPALQESFVIDFVSAITIPG